MRNLIILAFAFALLMFPSVAFGQSASEGQTGNDHNLTAIMIFLAFVALTLLVTWRAAKVTKSREAFYTAGGGISPMQNGFAIAGDFMSAATLLGITGLMFFTGFDALVLSFTIIIGWTLSLVLIAEKLRNLGKHTFVDVIGYRLKTKGVRILLVLCSLVVILFYLIGQVVGAGKLIQLLFGLDYTLAVITVSALMVIYVYFGGMIATTWVQMLKAVMLLVGGGYIAIALLAQFGFDFSLLLETASEKHARGTALAGPGGWLKSDPINVWTVGLTMAFGILGLPHVLMRFLTVKDGKGARKSVGYATIIMSIFYLFIIVIGFGAIAVLYGEPAYYNEAAELIGGSNMVALHAASAMGGDILLGFMSAVAFATILAVVAGLTLSGAAAISHDLYAVAMKDGDADPKMELRLSRIVTLVFGVISVLCGLAFENQNIAVVVATALAVAASVNFPLLALAIYWKGLSSRGALWGGGITLLASIIIIVLSDGVWVQILGNEAAIFPYIYPTIVTMPLGFFLIIVFSVIDNSARSKLERERFDDQQVRAETGLGAAQASEH